MISRGKQVKIGAMLSYLGIFLGIISGLIYNPWMIKKIGDADYGLYTLAMSLINIFLIDFGLDMASRRYIAKYRAENNQEAVDNIAGLITKLYFLITAGLTVIFVVLFFFVEGIYVKLTPAELEKFKVLYIMVAIYSITSFPFIPLKGFLSAYEKFIPLKICDLIYKIITVLLTAAALFAGFGVYVLVVVNLIASIFVTAMRIVFIRRYTPIKAKLEYKDSKKIRELFGFSIWSSISVITAQLLLSLAPSILGIVSGSVEIAVFGFAVSLEGHIYSFVNAINGFFMPQLSRISADKESGNSDERVLQLMVSVGKFILLLFALIFVGFAVLGRNFVSLLVGKEYMKAYYCVLLICCYGLIAYPQQIANTYAIVQNKVKDRAIISLIAFVAYLLLAFIFGKLWGSIGISIAVCISLFIQTALMNRLYVKKLNIRIWEFFRQCHLKMLPGFIVFTAVSAGISYIPLSGWSGFGAKTALITLAYAVIAWTMLLNKADKKLFLGKFIRK